MAHLFWLIFSKPFLYCQGNEVELADDLKSQRQNIGAKGRKPAMNGKVDPAILAALPPSMQLDLFRPLRSSQTYLKTVAFHWEIDEVKKSAAGKVVAGVERHGEKLDQTSSEPAPSVPLYCVASTRKSSTVIVDDVIQTYLDERGNVQAVAQELFLKKFMLKKLHVRARLVAGDPVMISSGDDSPSKKHFFKSDSDCDWEGVIEEKGDSSTHDVKKERRLSFAEGGSNYDSEVEWEDGDSDVLKYASTSHAEPRKTSSKDDKSKKARKMAGEIAGVGSVCQENDNAEPNLPLENVVQIGKSSYGVVSGVESLDDEARMNKLNNDVFPGQQELLQMFGLPYIIAQMEAEALCAYMELANLVDGVVTDDSDDIENEREKLICMALPLGSDYTEVGLLMLLKYAFHEEDGLRKFWEWIESPYPTILGKFDMKTGSSSRKRGSKLSDNDRNVSKNWHIPSTFPNEAVISVYVYPQVDNSTEPFSWGKPDPFVLRQRNVSKNWHIPSTFPNETVISAYASPQWTIQQSLSHGGSQIFFVLRQINVSKNWHIPSTFPNEAVISAYASPQADNSTEPFSWGKPDLFVLRQVGGSQTVLPCHGLHKGSHERSATGVGREGRPGRCWQDLSRPRSWEISCAMILVNQARTASSSRVKPNGVINPSFIKHEFNVIPEAGVKQQCPRPQLRCNATAALNSNHLVAAFLWLAAPVAAAGLSDVADVGCSLHWDAAAAGCSLLCDIVAALITAGS
ncbi:5'-3' exonuclease family protein [Actinidia rufa]|uniref:5'-3' exonuclease family protein n=1 Tax=Actinidia rufa TaxID=165716 RepID=A0A7J0H8S1_9ERIC|nr:5'-3' exonuclease family protein [Actinidia rufa]